MHNRKDFFVSTNVSLLKLCEEDLNNIVQEIAYLREALQRLVETPTAKKRREFTANVLQKLILLMFVAWIVLNITEQFVSNESDKKAINIAGQVSGWGNLLPTIGYLIQNTPSENTSIRWKMLIRQFSADNAGHYSNLLTALSNLYWHMNAAYGDGEQFDLLYEITQQQRLSLKDTATMTVRGALNSLDLIEKVVGQANFYLNHTQNYTPTIFKQKQEVIVPINEETKLLTNSPQNN